MKVTFYLTTIFIFCLLNLTYCQEQYYTAILENQELTVNEVGDKSQINWGRVDFSEVELYKISSQNNGYAEFIIEPTVVSANVGLAKLTNESAFFGFQFLLSNFNIVVEGQVVDLLIGDNMYGAGSTFKVEKCGNNINYYKDGVLLYTYCNNSGEIGELFQHTKDITSNISILDLNFYQDVAECGIPNIVGQGNTSSFRSSISLDAENSGDILSQLVKPNKYIYIQVIDKSGKYIRQFKKRSNSKGIILGCDEIRNLLKKTDYDIKIVIGD